MVGFLETSVSVGSSSVKALIFRIPAVLFNVFVYRIFGIIAMKYQSFTANVLFRESYLQRLIFIFEFFQNRKMPKKQAVLVLLFTVFAFISSMYDQVLWATESPGYIFVEKTKTGDDVAVKSQLVALKPTDHTVLLANNELGNTENFNLKGQLSTGIFKQGFNASLLAIPKSRLDDLALEFNSTLVQPSPDSDPFPLIHLTPNLLISFYNSPTVSSSSALETIQEQQSSCNLVSSGTSTTSLCFNALTPAEVTEKFSRDTPARPQLYFRPPISTLLDPAHPSFELSSATLSPWTSLATGSNSVMGKELLSISQSSKRYLFALDYWQVALRGLNNAPLDEAQISDLLERAQCFGSAGLDAAVKNVLKAQKDGTSLVYTEQLKTGPYDLAGSTYEYMYFNGTEAAEGLTTGGGTWSAADSAHILRCVTSELSLIMVDKLDSDTIFSEGMGEEKMECPESEGVESAKYVLQSAGGGDYKNGTVECFEMADYESDLKTGRMTRKKATNVPEYLVAVDASAGLVLSGFLGAQTDKESAETSLVTSAVEWYNTNVDLLNGLLLSRALISGLGRADLVSVSVRVITPGISYFQIVLVCLPILLLTGVKGWSWKLARTVGSGSRHYSSSLLQNMFTTTTAHASSEEKFSTAHDEGGGRGGYLWGMEEVVLRKGRDGQYVMGTKDGGVFKLCYEDGRERGDGGDKESLGEEAEREAKKAGGGMVREIFDGMLTD